jgi:hypothetical protein
MDHAKFCLAAQDRSTSESLEFGVLLRLRLPPKQEQHHGRAISRNGIAPAAKTPAGLTV